MMYPGASSYDDTTSLAHSQPHHQQQQQQQQQQQYMYNNMHGYTSPAPSPSVSPLPSSTSSSSSLSLLSSLPSDRCLRLTAMLWSADVKLRVPIPDTALFVNGNFHSYLFNSKKAHGEIRKKNSSSWSSPADDIRRCMISRCEQDPSNITPFLCVLRASDTQQSLVAYHALPRVIRQLTPPSLAAYHPNADSLPQPYPSSSQPFVQIIQAYIHPLHSLLYVSNYEYTGDSLSAAHISSHGQGVDMRGNQLHHLETVACKFDDIYQVSAEERAFFPLPPHSANAQELTVSIPLALARECERLVLLLLDFFNRVHGVGISRLSVEFIQDYARRLYVHRIRDVVFLAPPPPQTRESVGLQLVQQDYEHERSMYNNNDNHQVPSTDERVPPPSATHSNPSMSSAPHAHSASSSQLPPPPPPPPHAYHRPAAPPTAAPVSRAQRTRMNLSASTSVIAAPPPPDTQRSNTMSTTNLMHHHHHPTQPAARALTARPRPSSARPSTAVASSSSAAAAAAATTTPAFTSQSHTPVGVTRFTSDDIEENMRKSHTPRGMSAAGKQTALPRTSRERLRKEQEKNKLRFDTLMQFETRVEMDDRLMHGQLRPSSPAALTNSSSSSTLAANDGRADFLLFHWRHAAREANQEIVRLNEEIAKSSAQWHEREQQLLTLLQREERKVVDILADHEHDRAEKFRLQSELDALKASSYRTECELNARITAMDNDLKSNAILMARLEDTKQKQNAELQTLAHEKGEQASMIKDLQQRLGEAETSKRQALHELDIAERVRNELLEKLEGEERSARAMAQHLDLMCDWDSFEDMRHLFAKASGLAKHEGNRLRDVEALRAQVVKYTKDKGWQEQKAVIQKQAKQQKKTNAQRASATTLHQEPIPERRATDILYERSLNRMAY